MTHVVELPVKQYRDALFNERLILKDSYGIQRGDTLNLVCSDGWPFDRGRCCFAYATEIIRRHEGLKDGYVLILLFGLCAHPLRPFYREV
jgi:hypothetical protein